MHKFFIYPLNVLVIFLFSIAISLFEFSYFYEPIQIKGIAFLAVMIFFYCVQYPFLKDKVYIISDEHKKLSNTYKWFLAISVLGCLIEAALIGLPILSSSGRDEFVGIPILHVVFYSLSMVSVLYASLYSTKKDIIICFFIVVILSFVWLSRQLMIISFLILVISMIVRFRTEKLPWFKIIASITGIVILFALIGDYRQKLSGDYVEDYILVIGGANAQGEQLGSILYWLWLYLASPIYNLILNFDSYYLYGEQCNTNVYYGSCDGSYITAVLLPDIFVKYLSFDKFAFDLEIPFLNVGTGFVEAARIMGLPGVALQIFLHGLFFFIGYKLMPIKSKNAFIVYYSALSILMVFNNTFIKGEMFFVFIILFLMRFKIRYQ